MTNSGPVFRLVDRIVMFAMSSGVLTAGLAVFTVPKLRNDLDIVNVFLMAVFASMACEGIWMSLFWRNRTPEELAKENDTTLASYGLQRGQTTGFGWQCLAARRLVERGVRFVELIDTGSSGNRDAHGDMRTLDPLAKNVDQPIAALIKDLKLRGMFDETLIVWTTESGRTPFNKTADAKGREHHPWAFSSWLAGAGVKRGIVHGSTDEIGLHTAEKPVHVRDFHATILHLKGFDHERLTYRHAGLDSRLTGVDGANMVKELCL